MCGIVGYVGEKSAQDVVIEGLRRLEYRGYDSAGIALVLDGALLTDKKAGKLANLEKALAEHPLAESTTGIGHTRWATHGPPTDRNAHPHLGRRDRVAVVHNGIIENFAQLRLELEAEGVEMRSDTDTETAAHLLERELESGVDLTVAMQRVCQRLPGRVHPGGRRRRGPVRASSPRGATPRSWSGWGTARTSSGPTWPRSSSTRATRSSSARTRSSPSPGPGSRSPGSTARRPRARPTTSTGTSRPPRRTATTGSCARRSSSSRTPSPTRCWAGTPPAASCSSTRCGSPSRSCATSTRSS